MLSSIVQFSLRFRGVVLALACLLTGYGLFVASKAKLDVFPDFVPPQVTIQTEAPGLTPEQVETLVTLPIETAINGLGSLESLRSESIQGLSIVTAVFREDTEVFRARQMLAEKLAELASRLPVGVKAPRMTPLTSSTMDLLKVGLVSRRLSPMELRALADWTLKPRLLAVPGVAKCSVFGGEIRQWQIRVDPERLRIHGLTLPDVLGAARQATAVLGAGFIDTPNQRVLVETRGQSLDAGALGATVIQLRDGLPIRLKDVADILPGSEPKYGDALIQGEPGVLLTMSSQFGANTLEVTQALEGAIEELKPLFDQQGITIYPRLHRPATFIETALRNMRASIVLGAALVAGVLLLFVGQFRVAAISLTAIPLSLLAAVIVLDRFGVSLNTITLGGLAIAIGEVVDDAIIDVENIFRRLLENSHLAQPRPVTRVVLDASMEVRTAVVHATFIVALVFLPILTLTGLHGRFFAPLAKSYIAAILASLAVALTVTPALAHLLLVRSRKPFAEPRLQTWLRQLYTVVLRRLAPWPGTILVAAIALCFAALGRVGNLGGEFLPEFREGHFVLQVSTLPGTSLDEMRRIGTRIAGALRDLPGIATVEQQIGRAELGEDPWGPHRSEFHVDLKPMEPEAEAGMSEAIRGILSGFPGIQFEVLTFLADRIGETITGETAPVVISVFGNDFDALDDAAQKLAAMLREVPGATDVQVKSPPGAPRIAVQLRHERLSELGFRPAEVLEAIQTAYQGTVVAQTYEANRVTDVAVALLDSVRRDPETIATLPLRNAGGTQIQVRDVADVFATSGRHSILHDGARRRQTVTCSVAGRDVGSLVDEARRSLPSRLNLQGGMYLEFGGAAHAAAAAQHELLIHSAVAGVGILLLLSIVLRHWRNLVLVLCNVPFALVGGVLALLLAHHFHEDAGNLGMGALVGFVTLFGITMRNSIMMISHFEHLVAVEGSSWDTATAIRGASERLLPILMTALVTGLGLLPLAIGGGAAGREIEGPMAIVILGGLGSSTLLNLIALPVLAIRFGHFRPAANSVVTP